MTLEEDGEVGWEARQTPGRMKLPKPSCLTYRTKALSICSLLEWGVVTEVHRVSWAELGSDMPLTMGEASLCQTFSQTSISPRGHYILYLTVQNTEALTQ